MSLTRWDPFGEMTSLRRAMDRLFAESFVSSPPMRGDALGQGSGMVPLDVMETDDAVVVKASLPGVKPEDVDVSVHRNVVTISGEMRGGGEDEGDGQGRYHHRERWYGRFQRQVTLPTDVDTNACDASFDGGVLTIRLPKSEEARPRRISVGGARPAIEGRRSTNGTETSGPSGSGGAGASGGQVSDDERAGRGA